MRHRLLLGGLAVLLVLAVSAFALAWRWEIAPVDPPPRSSFDPAQVALGGQLAAIGNCNVCHTAPDGAAFAGGLALPTPFGTIHSTNITPDPATGIGRWSEAAFTRAMREGVDREGRHLYPAFPYDHFTRVSDADIRALYAFLMTRRPIAASPPPNDLRFPYDQRILLTGWKLLYLREGPLAPDPAHSPEWNRGRDLAEGLGHCGACHTPRNGLGAERTEAAYAGGEVENWAVYAINGQSPAPVPWDAASLAFYLRHGWHERHGVSRGPMAPVTANLGSVPEADTAAIGTYVADLMGAPGPERVARGEAALAAAARDVAAPRTTPAGSGAGGAGEAI
ncbi:MAG: cytochrome c, partial [Microvirga sp.]